MDEILISIISPCFKMKKYLKQFLDELPKQTIFNKLEIVLDHNEPDEEEIALVINFQQKYPNRLKHIIVEKVDPIGVSMNRCINESSGNFLAIWNIDDLRTNNSLELQYNKIIEDDNFGVVYGDYMIVRSFTSKKGEVIDCSRYSEKDLLTSMLLGPFFMFRKNICEKIGFFDEQLKVCADFDFACRLLSNTKAIYVKGLLGYYLNEGLGASTKPGTVLSQENNVIYLRYGIFDKLDYDTIALLTQYDIRYCILGSKLIYVGDYIKNYKDLINSSKKNINKGIRRYVLRKITMFKNREKIKKYIRSYIPINLLYLYKKIKNLISYNI